jgi:hypothetical protein
VSASMGLPDIGLAGLSDFCRIIRSEVFVHSVFNQMEWGLDDVQ